MKIKRLSNCKHSYSQRIRARQRSGTMKEYYDDENYLCFDEDELETYVPKKRGRPTSKRRV